MKLVEKILSDTENAPLANGIFKTSKNEVKE